MEGGMQTIPELLEDLNTIGHLAVRLQGLTEGMEGDAKNPKMVAATLYARAWGHFCAFTTLWKVEQVLECEILLRSSVEVAICMANVLRRPKEFIAELDEDAAKTIHGQVAAMKDANFEFASAIELEAKEIFGDRKGKVLVWKDLAEKVQANTLYMYHKALSGTAAHVTGISLLRTLSGGDEEKFQENLAQRTLGWMVGTMLTTCLDYSVIIEADDIRRDIQSIIDAVANANGVPEAFEFNG
jgi:hypothetical protein